MNQVEYPFPQEQELCFLTKLEIKSLTHVTPAMGEGPSVTGGGLQMVHVKVFFN